MDPGSHAPAGGSRSELDLSQLNDRQREAVLHAGSPLLILAGAGSGKTRVIATKVAHLIATDAVAPQHILAVTFTNKAAGEMRSRVRTLVAASGLGDAGARVMIRTFHAFGSWLLRVHGARLGFEPERLSIYDDGDVRQVLRGLLDPKYAASDIRAIAGWIAAAKDRGVTADGDFSSLRRGPFQMEDIYPRYQARLATMNAADFGDLILHPVTLLRSDRELRRELQARFRVVLVDEFQDANRTQFELLRLLHGPHTYLCVVGDDDQSIYRFRGADVDGFLTFPKRFAGTEVIRLEQNYRSTGAILDLASAVVSNNRRRMGKTLWTEQDQGELPVLTCLADQEQEARFCAQVVRGLRSGSVAILYRMNFQSRTFETLFQSLRIPYLVVGTVRFYEREEVKDALAYLTLLYNPRDQVAFRRAVTKPRRGVGEKSVARVLELVAAANGRDAGAGAGAGAAPGGVADGPAAGQDAGAAPGGVAGGPAAGQDAGAVSGAAAAADTPAGGPADGQAGGQAGGVADGAAAGPADGPADGQGGSAAAGPAGGPPGGAAAGQAAGVAGAADQAARGQGDLLATAMRVAATLGGRSGAGLARFVELMHDLEQAQEGSTVAELIRAAIDRSGLYDQVLKQDQAEHTNRVLNLEELVTAAGAYGVGRAGVAAFLEDARLAGAGGVDGKAGGAAEPAAGAADTEPVTLITVHNTKGLEFDHVLVTGLEEGIFPAAAPGGLRLALPPEEEEEERRLFYVAVTRARYSLHFTTCRRRAAFGQTRDRDPSRFLTEIPPECLQVSDDDAGAAQPGRYPARTDRYGMRANRYAPRTDHASPQADRHAGRADRSGRRAQRNAQRADDAALRPDGFGQRAHRSDTRADRSATEAAGAGANPTARGANSSDTGGTSSGRGPHSSGPRSYGDLLRARQAGPEAGRVLPVGQAVSHLDYGVGVIARRWVSAGQSLLEVKFQSGRSATFIEAFAHLDPISGEE